MSRLSLKSGKPGSWHVLLGHFVIYGTGLSMLDFYKQKTDNQRNKCQQKRNCSENTIMPLNGISIQQHKLKYLASSLLDFYSNIYSN